MTYEEAKAALTMRNALIEDGDDLTDVAEEYVKLFGK